MSEWDSLCRGCLASEAETPLHSDSSDLNDKFRAITAIDVKADEGLPSNLCQYCVDLVNLAYQFRVQCAHIDSEIKKAIVDKPTETSDIIADCIDEISETGKTREEKTATKMDVSNMPMVKDEPLSDESDDEGYYVLVIDNEDDEQAIEDAIEELNGNLMKIEAKPEVIDEPNEPVLIKNEPNEQPNGTDMPLEYDDNTVEDFILQEREYEMNSEDLINDDIEETIANNKLVLVTPGNIVNADLNQINPDELMLSITENGHDDGLNNDLNSEDLNDNVLAEGDGGSNSDATEIIQILMEDGTNKSILLKTANGLGETVRLVTNGSQHNQVILTDEQLRLLSCEDTELVIEYADENVDGELQQDGPLLCECGAVLASLADYDRHQTTHHALGSVDCALCGKSFESEEVLTGHRLLHADPSPQLPCPFCQQLIRRATLTQHIKASHARAKPRCAVCLKTFANGNNLKRHMMIHSGVKDFECDICMRRFSQKITMQTHRLTHEGGRRDEGARAAATLLAHACRFCDKMFSVASALVSHVEAEHSGEEERQELLCPECGEVLPSRRALASHAALHGDARARMPPRFCCKNCGKACTSNAMLIMHERVHTGERPFSCPLCTLRFKTKTHLRTHQLTHTREKKFGCSVCMKFFALKGNLVVHLRTHTGERPYVCTLCGEAFIDSKYLKKHKFRKHGIGNVPWNQY